MVPGASTQHVTIALALLIALCLLVLPAATDDARALETSRIVPGQIIVKLAPGTSIGQVNRRYDTSVQERFLDRKNTNIFLLKITDELSVRDKLSEIINDPGSTLVQYAERNYLSSAPEADARHHAFPDGSATPTSRDYSRDSSYPPSALNISAAHEISKGAGTTVAVLDTGAQLNHPRLHARFEGIPRYDFVDDDRNPSEPPLAEPEELREQEVVGHGTHVAGIVRLVAPRADLMPLRVLNRKGYGSTFHVAEAVAFADVEGADVINLSLGMPSWSELLREKVKEAISHGSTVVAAAGNYDSPLPQYPASKGRLVWVAAENDGLLAVTSVDPEGKKSGFANYGPWVDIAAPGEGILSTYPHPVKRYAYWSGTSMATPFVAGEAALIRTVYDRGPAGVEKRIRSGARCLDNKNPDYTGMLGAGHADIGASLKGDEGQPCAL